MPILIAGEPAPTTVQCVREVRVDVAYERLAEVVVFYNELLGLNPWTDDRQIPGGWGAGDPQRGAYFQFRHDPLIDPMTRRMTLVVDSLERLEQRLRERDWPCSRQHGLLWSDQWLCLADPLGHRIEIRQSRPL